MGVGAKGRSRALRQGFALVLLLGGAHCGGSGTNLADLVNQSPFADAGDDGASPGASSGGEAGSIRDPFAGAPAFAPQTGPSTHNAGQSCIQAECHATSGGGEAPSFFLGGTVYSDYAGRKPAPGVEVRVLDAQGNAASVFSGPEGTFYLGGASAKGLVFPVVVGARSETTARPMVTALAANQTSCGQQTCHVPGGGPTTSTGDYYPIHVP